MFQTQPRQSSIISESLLIIAPTQIQPHTVSLTNLSQCCLQVYSPSNSHCHQKEGKTAWDSGPGGQGAPVLESEVLHSMSQTNTDGNDTMTPLMHPSGPGHSGGACARSSKTYFSLSQSKASNHDSVRIDPHFLSMQLFARYTNAICHTVHTA